MLEPVIPFGIKGAGALVPRGIQCRKSLSISGDFSFGDPGLAQAMGTGGFSFSLGSIGQLQAAGGCTKDSDWAELREAQSMTLPLPNTAQAVIIDRGEADDIHPRDKWTVGERLAVAAKKVAFGKDVVYRGPTFKSMTVEQDKVRITFDNLGGGLKIREKYGYVKGFAVAGSDKVFHWAHAYQEGNDIVVYSEEVSRPVAIRYGWADNPDDVNVYNAEGLPASPFRTDTWEGITSGKK